MRIHHPVGRIVAVITLVVGLVGGFIVATASPAHALGNLTVDDASVAEGTGGTTVLAFVVHLSQANLTPITVDYTTVAGTATAGEDFTTTSGTLVFGINETQKTVNVALTEDAFPEPNETLSLQLSNVLPGTTISDGTGLGTIINDDGPAPVIRIADDGSEEGAPLDFVVSVDPKVAQPVRVNYSMGAPGDTALGTGPGADYVSSTGTFTIPANTEQLALSVGTNEDTADEPDEQLTVTLSGASNGVLADSTATGTITDDDDPPAVTISDESVGESAGSMTFDLTLTPASGRTTSVAFATADGTATAGSDYTGQTGTVTFSPGQTAKTVVVAITNDLTADAAQEDFFVNLTNPVNLTIGDAQGVGVITDDEAAPTLAIANLSVVEGTGGTTDASLTVTLSGPSDETVTVLASTGQPVPTPANAATADTDYAPLVEELITFAPGDTSETVTVGVVADALDEANETLEVSLTSPTNAGSGDMKATLTIGDDDATPTVSIADGIRAEGNSGIQTLHLPVTLSAPSGRTVTVAATNTDATATAGVDYGPEPGTTVTIPAGSTSVNLAVEIYGDQLAEGDETFTITLSNPTNATIGDGVSTVTIDDDDGGLPTISISDVAADEGDPPGDTTFTFDVTLSELSAGTVTVEYDTADITATEPGDYAAESGTVTFLPGDTDEVIEITVARDTSDESDETFEVVLSTPSGASLADASGVGTITNDDQPPPELSVSDETVGEGDGSVTVTVSLSEASDQDVHVDLDTADGDATVDDDYLAVSDTLTIPTGETSVTASIDIVDDGTVEGTETFSVILSQAENATIADDEGVVTIEDDDVAPPVVVSVADASATEGDPATVVVSLSAAAGGEVTVNVTTADGTAGGDDYTSVATVVTFEAGDTEETVEIATTEDTLDEPDEELVVELSDATGGATIGDGTAAVTIDDDDAAPTLSVGDVFIVEGDDGTSDANVTVSLSAASANTIQVRLQTSHDTTNALDATMVDTIVTFQPMDTEETVSVALNGDTDPEANEVFDSTLSEPEGATIADAVGIAIVFDDDADGTYTALSTPTRLLDTRKGIGRPGTTKVPGGTTVVVDVTGIGGVPTTGVQAVAVRVTAVAPSGPGFLRATPSGGGTTSNVNYTTGEVVGNLAIVPVGGDGNIRVLTTSTSHVLVDVFGWVASDAAAAPGSHQVSVTPSRILDTRTGLGAPGGTAGKLSAGSTRLLDVTGRGGVPATGVSAVILNVTVVQPTAGAHLTITPNGGSSTSSANFAAGETSASLVIVKVGSLGSIRYSLGAGSAHVVADVLGWFATPGTRTGSVITTVPPARLYDSRQDPEGSFLPGEEIFVPVMGEGGVPVEDVASAFLNLTATGPQKPGHFSASADGGTGTSNLNFATGQTVANFALVGLNQEFGDFVLKNHSAGRTHGIVDVFAWLSTPAP